MSRFLGLLACLTIGIKALAQQIIPPKRVYFKAPVEVFFRLNSPVPNAEYCLVMEEQLVATLDTFTFHSMLHHPGIYFTKIYTQSLDKLPYRKYYKTAPVAQGGGFYPFNDRKVNVTKLERPPKGRFYTQVESATNYRTWVVRKNPSDFGPSSVPNTLPGIDSVRVIYTIAVRPKWKRGDKKKSAK